MAVRLRLTRFVSAIGLCAGLALGGCAQTPQATGPQVIVPPVAGLDGDVARALSAAMAEELSTTQGLNARAGRLDEGGTADAFVMGRVEGSESRESLLWLTTRWAVMAPDGTTLGTAEREIVVDKVRWMQSDPLMMGFAVSETGPAILAELAEAGLAPLPVPAADPTPQAMTAQPDPVSAAPSVSAETPDVSRLMAESFDPDAPAPGQPTTATAVLETLAPSPEPAMQTLTEPLTEPEPLPQGTATAEEVLEGLSRPASNASAPSQPMAGQTLANAEPVEPPRESILPGPPTPDTNAWARSPIFLVRPVYGAPGSGNRELTMAVRKTLEGRGARVTDNPTQASHVMQGSVRLSQPFGGQQKARIVWLVTTVSGKEVGTATQENAISAGSLDGSWGVVADHIATAAVDGVQELFGVEIGRAIQ